MTGTKVDPAALLDALKPGAELIDAEPVAGGVSAAILRVRYRACAGTKRKASTAIVRILPARAALDAAAEARLMGQLSNSGFPVPGVLAYCTGTTAHALLLEHVDGTSDFTPGPERIEHMAHLAAALHRLPTGAFDMLAPATEHPIGEAYGKLDPARTAPLADFARAHPPEASGAPVPCHGDFWPGNLLWTGPTEVTVLDWEDASLGDRLHDLAIARLELAWETGVPAMERFTARYLARCEDGERLRMLLPRWDLHETMLRLGWLPRWPLPEAVIRRSASVGLMHAERAAQAIAANHPAT